MKENAIIQAIVQTYMTIIDIVMMMSMIKYLARVYIVIRNGALNVQI